jgi:hypothetical protein
MLSGRIRPQSIKTIDCEITVESDEPERRLELLHTNIRKFCTISITPAAVVQLTGSIRRADNLQIGTAE